MACGACGAKYRPTAVPANSGTAAGNPIASPNSQARVGTGYRITTQPRSITPDNNHQVKQQDENKSSD